VDRGNVTSPKVLCQDRKERSAPHGRIGVFEPRDNLLLLPCTFCQDESVQISN
jgi:hypothetical protein